MRDQIDDYRRRNAQPLLVFAHHAFQMRPLVPEDPVAPALLDPSGTVSATYGVAFQNRFRDGAYSNRVATFVIDPEGVIRYADDRPETDVLRVLDDLKAERALIRGLLEAGEGPLLEAARGVLGPIGPDTGSLLPALVGALKDDRPEVRAGAAAALCWVAPAAGMEVPALTRGLKDKDARVRRLCAVTLGRLGVGSREAIPMLVSALKDEQGRVRSAAGFSLGRIGPSAVPALLKALGAKDAKLRAGAAEVLPRFPSPGRKVVAGLAGLLKDEVAAVRLAAAQALFQLPGDPEGKGPAVPALARALQDDDPAVRAEAFNVLGRLGAEARAGVPILREALRHKTPDVRRKAATALGWVGTDARAAIPDLLRATTDADAGVRAVAIDVLVALVPDPEAIAPALRQALKDREGAVRVRAAVALARVASAQAVDAVPVLTAVIQDREKDRRQREEAAHCLGLIGPGAKEAVPALLVALKDRTLGIRPQAAVALGRIGREARAAVPAIVKLLEAKESIHVPRMCAIALGHFGPEAREAVPALLRALQTQDAPTREAVVEALRKIDPKALEKAGGR